MTGRFCREAAIHVGDCLAVLRTMADSSIDSIVTDPPYGLSFMGKKWDYDVPSVEVWAECLRVSKPGGHLLAFAGTRTQHRMAVRIEDAGFEIRDMIAWVYGSGFPKSLDVSKAIDKAAPRAGMFDAFAAHFSERWESSGLRRAEVFPHFPHYKNADSIKAQISNWKLAKNVPSRKDFEILCDLIGLSDGWETLISRVEAERAVIGMASATRLAVAPGLDSDRSATTLDITAPATEAARQWEGWGTALKPALEPITVARKPLAGTVAANVLAHGTGALNIDGCRVGTSKSVPASPRGGQDRIFGAYGAQTGDESGHDPNVGRWPANLIHDGSDEVRDAFPGGESRFFYAAKASRKDRDEGNNHPTVKPTDLMRYLCRLVTPPGGLILDPFAGSGSTGKAAILEGFRFVGIEREPEYAAIAEARIAAMQPKQASQPDSFDLFGDPIGAAA